MKLSIIVPVLNEAELLTGFLRHLRDRAPEADIIVVEGGSTDGSLYIVRGLQTELVLSVIQTGSGRARQMNAGAAMASGDVLWFVHVDSRVAPTAVHAIEQASAEPEVAGGCFRLRIPRRRWIYRVSDWLGNAGVDAFHVALGDHGIFCRRDIFQAVEGFPDVPLMEDAELYRAVGRLGRVRQLREFIDTSPRFYEKHGACRTTVFYAIILALYFLGVRPEVLARLYARIGRKRPAFARRGRRTGCFPGAPSPD
ncbi:MAG TPA: TIGR04283 family arsenosugar biosynthesis glycosyltransferase [Chthoniobacterales bacterium]